MASNFKTKRELAQELGLSESTLRRRLNALEMNTSGKLLSPIDQVAIRMALGVPPRFPAPGYGWQHTNPV